VPVNKIKKEKKKRKKEKKKQRKNKEKKLEICLWENKRKSRVVVLHLAIRTSILYFWGLWCGGVSLHTRYTPRLASF
jgi:hypothetical protein